MSITTDTLTKHDIARIEESLKQVIEMAKNQKSSEEVGELLKTISHTVNHLNMTVEFDHEKRLRAIEEFLQNL